MIELGYYNDAVLILNKAGALDHKDITPSLLLADIASALDQGEFDEASETHEAAIYEAGIGILPGTEEESPF